MIKYAIKTSSELRFDNNLPPGWYRCIKSAGNSSHIGAIIWVPPYGVLNNRDWYAIAFVEGNNQPQAWHTTVDNYFVKTMDNPDILLSVKND